MRAKSQKILGLATAGFVGLFALSACGVTADDSSTNAGPHAEFKDEQWQPTDMSKDPAAAAKRTDSFVSTIRKPGGVFLPGFYHNGWDGNAISPIFASLVVADESGKPKADLADKWEISADKLTYTFHIRDGAKFSDGSPVTAEDVKFTLTLLNDPQYAGGVDFSKIRIQGTDDYKKGSATELSGITVVDPSTVKISTEQINPLSLTTLGGQVISKNYYGKGYQKGKLDYLRDLYGKPMGAGPYQLDKYVEGQEIDYKANANYYSGKPAIGTLIFKVMDTATTRQNFQNGEIDHGGFGSDPANIQALRDLGYAGVSARVISDFGQIFINNSHAPLGETKVRQALYYGLDRQQVIDVGFKGLGKVADVYASPTLWSFTDEGVTKYNFDQAKAGQLLDEAGWKKGSDGVRSKDGKPFKLSYITTRTDDPVIPIAKQNYKDLGIDFSTEVLDANTTFTRLNSGDYDLAGFRTDGLSDPDDAVREYASKDPKINPSRYQNDEVTKLIHDGSSTFDEAKRKEVYAKLYQKLSQDPPTILLDYRKSISGWNGRIEGAEEFVTGSGDSAQALAKLKINTAK